MMNILLFFLFVMVLGHHHVGQKAKPAYAAEPSHEGLDLKMTWLQR